MNEITISVIRRYLSVLQDERTKIAEGIQVQEQRLELSKSELVECDRKIQQLSESLQDGDHG